MHITLWKHIHTFCLSTCLEWHDIKSDQIMYEQTTCMQISFTSVLPLKFAPLGHEVQKRLQHCVSSLPLYYVYYHHLSSHYRHLEANYLLLQKYWIHRPMHVEQELACLCHGTCLTVYVHALLVWYGSESHIIEYLMLSVLQLLFLSPILSVPLLFLGSFVWPSRWLGTFLCYYHIIGLFPSRSHLRAFNMYIYLQKEYATRQKGYIASTYSCDRLTWFLDFSLHIAYNEAAWQCVTYQLTHTAIYTRWRTHSTH